MHSAALFAKYEIAGMLLEHGARIDARDEDHDSTPAQWLIGEAPEVTRFLLDRGAAPDIFMAAALGERQPCGEADSGEPGVPGAANRAAAGLPTDRPQELRRDDLPVDPGFQLLSAPGRAAEGAPRPVRFPV